MIRIPSGDKRKRDINYYYDITKRTQRYLLAAAGALFFLSILVLLTQYIYDTMHPHYLQVPNLREQDAYGQEIITPPSPVRTAPPIMPHLPPITIPNPFSSFFPPSTINSVVISDDGDISANPTNSGSHDSAVDHPPLAAPAAPAAPVSAAPSSASDSSAPVARADDNPSSQATSGSSQAVSSPSSKQSELTEAQIAGLNQNYLEAQSANGITTQDETLTKTSTPVVGGNVTFGPISLQAFTPTTKAINTTKQVERIPEMDMPITAQQMQLLEPAVMARDFNDFLAMENLDTDAKVAELLKQVAVTPEPEPSSPISQQQPNPNDDDNRKPAVTKPLAEEPPSPSKPPSSPAAATTPSKPEPLIPATAPISKPELPSLVNLDWIMRLFLILALLALLGITARFLQKWKNKLRDKLRFWRRKKRQEQEQDLAAITDDYSDTEDTVTTRAAASPDHHSDSNNHDICYNIDYIDTIDNYVSIVSGNTTNNVNLNVVNVNFNNSTTNNNLVLDRGQQSERAKPKQEEELNLQNDTTTNNTSLESDRRFFLPSTRGS